MYAGGFERGLLTKIFSDFIYAYLATAKDSGLIAPVVMFILKELEDDQPIAVPFNLNNYDEKILERMVETVIQEYPPDRFNLEMVMYSRFKPDYLSAEHHDVLFGARDMTSGTIHSVYSYTRKGDGGRFKHKKVGIAFDQWVPTSSLTKLHFDPMKDSFLKTATEVYAVLASMKRAKIYAK